MGSLSLEIVQLFNKRLESAFEVVFNLYYPRLVYFAKEYVPYDDARDLVQDAFVNIWNKKNEFFSEAQLQSYLYTEVKNSCLMYLRHEKVKRKYKEQFISNHERTFNQKALEQLDTSVFSFHEIESIIERTLNELPARCREIIQMSRFEGKKNQEIADELQITVKAVEAQITKAIKIFKIALKDYLPLVGLFFILDYL